MSHPQANLFEPIVLTRRAARKQALDLARARRDTALSNVSKRCERDVPGWIALAVQKLASFARAQGGVFSIEMARAAIDSELPRPPELRVWGQVTVQAVKAGVIERVPRTFLPAASSNGCPKPAWKRGPRA